MVRFLFTCALTAEIMGSLFLQEVQANDKYDNPARYVLSCYSISLKPTILRSFDHGDIYEGELLFVSYKDGRDLSFNPSEFKNFPDRSQIMRGSLSDLKPRLAYIPDKSKENGVSFDIYVLSDEWDCQFYDFKK